MYWYDIYTDISYQLTVPFVNGTLKRMQLFFIICPFLMIWSSYCCCLCGKTCGYCPFLLCGCGEFFDEYIGPKVDGHPNKSGVEDLPMNERNSSAKTQ
jgi:hypothetical protein